MSLRDTIALDNENVFFELEDFAEKHTVEGVEISIVIDKDHLEKLQAGQNLGIAESDLLIFGRTAELPKKKTPGSLINIDGREYIVDYWSDNKGVSQITLRQNRTV